MEILNLPQINSNIRKNGVKLEIFDVIRKKYIILTPEEWVRQHLLHYLILDLEYPKSLIRVEAGMRYNSLRKRSDILVYDRNAQPFFLLECKSADTKLGQRTFEQAAVYNKEIGARFIGISNGLKHYCSEVLEDNTYNTLDLFPKFPQ